MWLQRFKRLQSFLNQHEFILILLLFAILLRFPSLFEPTWYGDENIYLAIGQKMRSGAVLYQDITDYPNKPPLIYLLAATVGSVANFRLLLLLWQLVGVIGFYKLAQVFTKNATTTFFATLAYVYYHSTPLIEGNIANAENFFVIPIIWAAYLLISLLPTLKPAKTNQHQLMYLFWIGILLSVGFLFKIHALLDIAAFGGFLSLVLIGFDLSDLPKLFSNLRLPSFLAGLALPVALMLLLWIFQGVWPHQLLSNASSSQSYVSAWQTESFSLAKLIVNSLPARLVITLFLSGLVFLSRKKLSSTSIFAFLWLTFTLFAALLSGRPYPHYLLQIVAPAILVASLWFSASNKTEKLFATLGLLIVFGAYQLFGFQTWSVKTYYNNFLKTVFAGQTQTQYFANFDSRMTRNYQLARYIQTTTTPEDEIYIWGTEPGVYVLSDRVVTGPLVTSFHVDDLDYFDQTIDLLVEHQPKLIIISSNEWRAFPELFELIDESYAYAKTISDPTNPDIYAQIYRHVE